jgi:hypothetical protein
MLSLERAEEERTETWNSLWVSKNSLNFGKFGTFPIWISVTVLFPEYEPS